MPHHIRSAAPEDSAAWAAVRHLLWPEVTIEHHAAEIEQFFAGLLEEPQAVLMAESFGGKIIGLVEISIRQQVPGCKTDRIGFIEGLFVSPEHRHHGIARSLLRAAQTWTRAQGCTEFASDRSHGFIFDDRFGK